MTAPTKTAGTAPQASNPAPAKEPVATRRPEGHKKRLVSTDLTSAPKRSRNVTKQMSPALPPEPDLAAPKTGATISFESVFQNEVKDVVTGQSFENLLLAQANKSLPLILGVCACSEHRREVTASMQKSVSHPFCLNGTLLFDEMSGDSDHRPGLAQLTDEQVQALRSFAGREFNYFVINPKTRAGSVVCSKTDALGYYEGDALSRYGILRANQLNLSSDDDADDALYTAGIFYAGIGIERDIDLATSLLERCRKYAQKSSEADALLMCVNDKNYKLLLALVKLGLDPNGEDKDGLTAVEQATKLGDKMAMTIFRGQRGRTQ